MRVFNTNEGHPPAQRFEAVYEMGERWGVSIFPVKDKKPRLSWKDYQERLPNRGEFQQWFRDFPETDFAMVAGHGFAVVDIDSRGSKRTATAVSTSACSSQSSPTPPPPTAPQRMEALRRRIREKEVLSASASRETAG